jgi:4-hydroxy-2-oxoheptanedioate aldolase
VIQIERAEAVTRAAEILAVPGVDAVMPGPVDLAASLGAIADYADLGPGLEASAELVREVEAAAVAAGVLRVRFTMSVEAGAAALRDGCEIAFVGCDVAALAGGIAALVDGTRSVRRGP